MLEMTDEAKRHLLGLWRSSKSLFLQGDMALAAFAALTLFEEVGKVVILGQARFSGWLDRKSFYNHRRKHDYAVTWSLFVNSRVTRIYGEAESKFAGWYRTGQLARIRSDALYLKESEGRILAPEQVLSRDDCLLLVCIAGEALAEIQGTYTGTGPQEWLALTADVDTFRAQAGFQDCDNAP